MAITPHAKANEVCVAWVARDAGSPQVFLTRVGSDGKTKLQRVITQASGEASDVAIAPYGDGWIVAWVDHRDGNGEVYVARVGLMLGKLGPEKRITNAPGDASSVSLQVVGDEVLVAYADSRDNVSHGTANPYAQKLRATNLERMGDEHRLAASDLHTRWLGLSRSGQDVVLGWLTQPLPGADESVRGFARVARIDTATMRLVGAPVDVHESGTDPVAMGLRCGQNECRGAVAVSRPGGAELVGFSWIPRGPRVQRGVLARATNASSVGVEPAVVGDAVFFVDHGLDKEDRLRRVLGRWSD